MRALIKHNSKMEHMKGDGDHLAAEAQLAALQEQLVAVMLENQHLAEEVKTLRESSASEQLRQQLEREREKSRILMERLQEKEAKEKERGEREARERERHTREKSFPPGDKSPSSLPPPPSRSRSPSRGRFAWKRRGLEKSKSLDQSEFLASLNGTTSSTTTTSTSAGAGAETSCCHVSASWVDDDHHRESDSDDGDRGNDSDTGSSPSRVVSGPVVEESVEGSKDPWWRQLEMRVVAAVGELLRDFSEVAEEELPDGDPEGDQLSVKKLKENILRFGSVMRPLTDLSAAVTSLLRWESPSATLLALVIYLYSVLFGWVLPLVLLMAILRLSINYMKKRGWTQNFFRRLRREGGESVEPTTTEAAGLGDKFALVLQVARRVQNQLGAVSNAAEKLKNLLLWEHEATRRLYFFLWLVLLASVLLPAAQLFTLIGVYLGLKFFVLDFIFFRYPRIRLKYDSTSRLWDTLPTDADLERRGDKNRTDNGNSSPDLTSFLELFSLPATETPLPGWQSGRRCTLVNRDRSLTSAFKNGRLYLTNSFLCFERSKSQSVKNMKLSLKEVRIEKANSYPWIPGGGMAIEVSVDGTGKGYFFAGILNRDEVFDGIIEGCKKLGATWCEAALIHEKNKDVKESKEIKEKGKEAKDFKETKDVKDSKDSKEAKEAKDK
ncbi:GRAM domain-containing protein 4 isoform X7 [Procambarus clarkii]|uniref:GRAM domain-containing protein 4 isoform X7 n=1 Tax=Procambarus clarkii TaxID=6728 RepID=UPI003742C1CF